MKFKKILVLNFITTTVGDSLYILPFIQKLKKEFPKSQVYLTGSNVTKQVIGNDPSINNYILIHDLEKLHKNSRLKNFFLFPKIFYSAVKKVREISPDVCFVLLPNFPPYLLIPFLAGVPKRYGFSYPGSVFDFTLTKKTPFRNPGTTGEKIHLSKANLELLKLIDVKIEEKDLLLTRPVSKKEKKEAKKLLKNLKKPLVAFQPGAKHKNRQWPKDNFVELGRKIIKNYNASVLLIGSPAEKDLLKKIKREIGKNTENLAGKTTLSTIAGVLENCKLTIGNDSGIMHYAASVGCNTITLFGRTSPEHSKPLGKGKNLVVKSPIWTEEALFEKEPKDEVSKYLEKISVNLVWKKVEEIL